MQRCHPASQHAQSADGSTLAVALGLTAVHGGMLELLNTFVVLSAALLPVDIYVFIFGGLTTWLILALVAMVITRCGCIWFGCATPACVGQDACSGAWLLFPWLMGVGRIR